MPYNIYKERLQQIADLKYASAVLQWDQETYMPVNGANFRGRQLATLAEMAHELFTCEITGNIINSALEQKDFTEDQIRNLQLSKEDYEKNKKLPAAFVRKLTEAINKSYHAWIEARKANDFKIFAGPLEEIVKLKQQEAELLGYEKHPYDALMNDYDKGVTVEKTDKLFAELKPGLQKIIDTAVNQKTEDSFLFTHYPKDKQWELGLEVLKNMHYDFKSGRQDISEHPFTTNFSAQDVRVTTRIDENDFSNMLWSCIHEGGHALYEQGLPVKEYGLPLGEYCSLSIHESQSRLWENCIGRSLCYWEKNYGLLQKYFPDQLRGIDVKSFYKAINKVQPSLIRTSADELTYHFHVIIRYEIEKALIEGNLAVNDIPQKWNELYKKYLNVDVPDDKNGCLQDVHWSHGSFGYFATYSMGSLYAAQFWETIIKEIPAVCDKSGEAQTGLIWKWLKENIYQYGRKYTSAELCKKATGQELNSNFFLKYAKEKFL